MARRTAVGAEAAKLLESQLTAEYKTGQITPAERMTAGELVKRYLAAKETEVRRASVEKTQRIMNRYVLPTLEKERLDRLNRQKMQDWKLAVSALGLSLRTNKNIYSEFRAMLNYAVKMEYIAQNPLTAVGNFKDTDFTPPQEKLHYYTADEFLRYKAAALADAEAKGTLSEYAYYVFFCITYYMEMRKGEINALRWSDINGGLLTVRRSVTQKVKGESAVETLPKNKTSYRTIEIPAPLMEILAEYKKRLESRDAYRDNYRVCGGGEEGVLPDTSLSNHNVMYATQMPQTFRTFASTTSGTPLQLFFKLFARILQLFYSNINIFLYYDIIYAKYYFKNSYLASISYFVFSIT